MFNDLVPLKRNFKFFIIVMSIVCTSSAAFAAIVDCSISGTGGNVDKVIVDTNGNHIPDPGPDPGTDPGEDDAYWNMQYDDVGHVLLIVGNGMLPIDMPTFHERIIYSFDNNGDTLVLTEMYNHSANGTDYDNLNDCHLVNMIRTEISRPSGAAYFNSVDIFWLRDNPGGDPVLNCIPGNEDLLGGVEGYPLLKWNAGDRALSGGLVDTNADGIYDRIQATFYLNVAHPWFPNLVIDEPIQYYPSPSDRQYWVLPSIARLWISYPGPDGPFDVFIPMDGDTSTCRCGGTDLFSVSRIAPQGGNDHESIPALNVWGTIIFALLMLISGIWFMKKYGFGDALSRKPGQ